MGFHSPLIRPAIYWGGNVALGGGTLDSHDITMESTINGCFWFPQQVVGGNILPSGGLYATYHLLGEPQTTIDTSFFSSWLDWSICFCHVTVTLKLTAKAP